MGGEGGWVENELDESLSAPIKIAVLVVTLPKDYQDMCFQQASLTGVQEDSEKQYLELRDKILNIASQRVSMITPTPMDIDALTHGPCPPSMADEWGDIWNYGPPGINWEEPQGSNAVNQYNQYEIYSVVNAIGGGKGFGKGTGKGDGSCNICGQFGHWSRECPSNTKGGGKGGKGFGKSWQGPSQFGCGKGGDGKGFGYQGTCFLTVSKLDIKQPSARMHELLRCLRSGQKSRLVVWR